MTTSNNEIRYPYKDEHGQLIYTKVKKTHPHKTFYWERVVDGTVVRSVKGCRKIPYRLPELLYGIKKGLPIFLVEGEKDVESLLTLPIIATTTTGALEWSLGFTQLLHNAHVIILYDSDKTGYKRRDMLQKELYRRVKKLQVIDLGFEYSESHGKDISDWLETHTKEDLFDLVANTEEYSPPDALKFINIGQLFALKIPPRTMLLDPIIPSQSLMLIAARRGVGKTHIALGIAYAVSTGGRFLKWKSPRAARVLFIDGEMPAALMQERLAMVASMGDKLPIPENFTLLTPDLQLKSIPNLSDEEGRVDIDYHIKDHDLIVLDNLSSLFRSGSENEAESWQKIQEWALNWRRQGKSIIFVHHLGKNGTQRGTSKREDTVDTIMILRQEEDYNPANGAQFTIHFDKARHFYGDDAKPFSVELKKNEENYWWQQGASS